MLSLLYIAGKNKITDLIYRTAGKGKKSREGTEESRWRSWRIQSFHLSKRFNSSGQLTTVFDPAEAVVVSTAPVFVCNKVYIEKKGEESIGSYCRPMES